MKTEIYSWRVTRELKGDLEREARRRNTSVSAVLDLAARDWLKNQETDGADEDVQKRLHLEASKYLGAFAGGDSRRSERVRASVRERLRRTRER